MAGASTEVRRAREEWDFPAHLHVCAHAHTELFSFFVTHMAS